MKGKSKLLVLALGVLLIAAISAPSAFANLTGYGMGPGNDKDVTGNNNYQDMMVRPAVDVIEDNGDPIQGDDATEDNNNSNQSSQDPTSPNFDEESFKQFQDQMMNWGSQWTQDAQENGAITPDQANAYQDHFKYMNDFMNDIGAEGMYNMMGSIMGGYGNGNDGYGMMGGY
ncbi:MAG: hypothetical protein FH756_04625 [Firmicutes bacterium]|nr:hypothetical protein [Bacillota bacterium]